MTNKTNKKIAILKTDVFVDPATKEDRIYNLIQHFFKNSGFELDFYDVIHHKFPDPKKYSTFLITGSKHSVNEPLSWIIELQDFINNNNLAKLIGICFGHQLIAKARGGVVNNGDWHVGIKKVKFYSSGNHFYDMRFNHHDYVEILPPNAALLATSEECKYSMFQQGSHTLAMQFHPEFTYEHHKKVISRINGHNAFSPTQYEIFKQDIEGHTDSSKALEVIKNFLLL